MRAAIPICPCSSRATAARRSCSPRLPPANDSAAAVEHVRPQLAGSGVRFGGNDVAFDEINKRTSSDLQRAETFAFPILLLLSFWVFRGLIAAALPLLVGGFAIVLTFLLLRLIDQFAGVVDLRRQPRHRHGPGSGDRLQPVRALALPRGAGPRPRHARGDHAHAADRRAHRALQLADGRRRACLDARVPARASSTRWGSAARSSRCPPERSR